MAEFADLLGRTIMAIEVNSDKDQMKFALEGGFVAGLWHSQDCCEGVAIEEIHGDLDDLIDTPILLAEEATYSNEAGPNGEMPEYPDSWTWTFYKLATVKGHVTLRWLGESNGYYSESVDFHISEPVDAA